jgi:WXG100 family type VII secretion target
VSRILVTFGAIDTAAADTDAIAGHIDATLEQLEGYLAPMKQHWQGAASTDYQALQSRWDRSADDLNLVLRQIAIALRTANENYTGTESYGVSMWSADLT